MVVDDNEFNLMALKLLIQQHFNIEIHEASNGEEAVTKYKQLFSKQCNCPCKAVKLIFMDIQMPKMNGIQASEAIFAYLRNHLPG